MLTGLGPDFGYHIRQRQLPTDGLLSVLPPLQELLGQADAVKPIAALLTDEEIDPTAGDDKSTIADAAVRALEAIGTSEAIQEVHNRAGA